MKRISFSFTAENLWCADLVVLAGLVETGLLFNLPFEPHRAREARGFPNGALVNQFDTEARMSFDEHNQTHAQAARAWIAAAINRVVRSQL